MQTARKTGQARVVWIDWLKILVVVGIVAYHVALVFSFSPWVVQNQKTSLILAGLAGWGYLWGIQLLFLLAGAASWFSLRSRGAGRFLRERFLRLFVPLVVALALLSPPQAYVQALNRYHYHGTYLQFLGSYVRRIRFYPSPHWLADYGYHLWFLGFLFIVSVAALPVAAWLRRPGSGARAVDLAGRLATGPASLLAAAVPVGIVQGLLRPAFPWPADWPDLAGSFVFFLCGFVLMASPPIAAIARRSARTSLLIGVVAGLGAGIAAVTGKLGHPTLDFVGVGLQVVLSLASWSWVMLLLSLAMNHLNRGPARLQEASEATLPFYVLHHPIVVGIAFFVVQTSWPVYPKFFLVLASAMLVTGGLTALILPFAPLRFVFGMGPPPPRRSGGRRPARPALLRLRDGRRLAFVETGDPHGVPVIHHHGMPGSRLEYVTTPQHLRELGIRLITPDRPGYGWSDKHSDGTVLDWAADIEELADHLGLEKFAVMSLSGGGIYALAVAAALPERVTTAVLTGCPAPMTWPGAWRQVSLVNQFGLFVAWRAPRLFAWLAGMAGPLMREHPEAFILEGTFSAPAPDRETIAIPAVRDGALATLREAARSGLAGYAHDLHVLVRPWGYDPSIIRVPVHLWHGDADGVVPFAHALWLASSIPTATLVTCHGEAHMVLWQHQDEILAAAAAELPAREGALVPGAIAG